MPAPGRASSCAVRTEPTGRAAAPAERLERLLAALDSAERGGATVVRIDAIRALITRDAVMPP